MVTANQAVRNAVQFLTEIPGNAEVSSIRVEELELGADELEWRVTLSYFPPNEPEPDLSDQMQSILAPERVYKTFDITTSTGRVRSMKIRELQ